MPGRNPSTRRTGTTSALELLKTDHATAKKLFKQFEKFKKAEDAEGMLEAARAVCNALRVHAQIEEEIFYPALREAGGADDALDEANVEHSHLKELVTQLDETEPADDLFAARLKVLSEYVQHHVDEEESTIFSKARKAKVDLAALGEQLAARKSELEAGQPPVDMTLLAGSSRAAPRRNGQRAMR